MIVHLFSEELVGWLDDLSLKSMSPPHPPTLLPVCVCDPRAHSDIQSVTDIDYCRLDAKSTGEQTETKKKKDEDADEDNSSLITIRAVIE